MSVEINICRLDIDIKMKGSNANSVIQRNLRQTALKWDTDKTPGPKR